MKKFIIIFILSSIFFFYGYSKNVAKTAPHSPQIKRNKVLPTVPTPAQDERVFKVKKFFILYSSSMGESADDFVRMADENNIDYRLLPAIAGVESTFGKFTPSCTLYNAFGWTSTTSPCGFYRFQSYSEAASIISKELGRGKAYRRFQKTKRIADLADVYNPVSPNKWSNDVIYFMGKLE